MSIELTADNCARQERAFLRLDFAVLALPRSGTTWASNWLSTDTSICWHDPIGHSTPMEMDVRPSQAKYRGISCTGSWMFSQWIPPEKTVILERPVQEVQASLKKLGLPEMSSERLWQFKMLDGRRFPYQALFDERAEAIWQFLLPEIPFNRERHRELVQMSIQPDFNIIPDTSELRRVMKELAHG